MELPKNLRDDAPLTSLLPAAALSVFALLSLRKGKRLRALLAGLGAVALGYRASTESGDGVAPAVDQFDTEPTTTGDQQRCAACGDPIVAGQLRTPNENGETVHEACLESPA